MKPYWAHTVLLDQDDAGHARAAVHGALAGRPEHEVGRRRRLALDIVADALHDRGQAQGGEGARDGDVAFGNAEQRLRGGDRVVEARAIVGRRVLMEALELSGRLDPAPELVVDRVSDDQGVLPVLVEDLVDLDVQRVGRGIPDDLVDPDHLAAGLATGQRARPADDEYVAIRHAGRIDRSVERDRDPSGQTEPVERVEGLDVLTVRWTGGAVGIGEVDAPAGGLSGVDDREDVARKRARGPIRELEERVYPRRFVLEVMRALRDAGGTHCSTDDAEQQPP